MKNQGKCSLRSGVRAIPLSMTLLVSALVLQNGYALRSEMVKDDELVTSVLNWIHPTAIVFLLVSYAVSFIVLFKGCRIGNQ